MLWDFDDDEEASRDPSTMSLFDRAKLGLGSEIYQLHEKLRFERRAPEALWHYTSGPALIEIIGNCQLWATQVSCLNDQAEFVHAARLLSGAFKAIYETVATESHKLVLHAVMRELEVDLALQSAVFIASFSEQPNDLNQWRCYGGGEGGYTLGFNYRGMDFGQPADDFILPVIYDPPKQIEIMTAAARDLFSTFQMCIDGGMTLRDVIADFAIPATIDALTVLGPFLKDESFKAEAEWRIVSQLPAGEEHRLKFRQKQSLLSRHLPMDFHRNGLIPSSGKLPLAFLGVGPCRHQAVSVNSVIALLKTKEYPTRSANYQVLKADHFRPADPPDVVVWASDIPFRGS